MGSPPRDWSGRLKTCVACFLERELSAFCKSNRWKDGLNNVCRVCAAARNKEWRRINGNGDSKAAWAIKQARRIASTGPIPPRCEICGQRFVEGSQVTAPHWDHDHGTTHGRGWLCLGCNAGLGSFGDNPAILKRALIYLTMSGGTATRPVLR